MKISVVFNDETWRICDMEEREILLQRILLSRTLPPFKRCHLHCLFGHLLRDALRYGFQRFIRPPWLLFPLMGTSYTETRAPGRNVPE